VSSSGSLRAWHQGPLLANTRNTKTSASIYSSRQPRLYPDPEQRFARPNRSPASRPRTTEFDPWQKFVTLKSRRSTPELSHAAKRRRHE